MKQVNITELRTHLPEYLSQTKKGKELWITAHGKVIARILPPLDEKAEARSKLAEWRKNSRIGDVVSPIATKDWKVTRGHS